MFIVDLYVLIYLVEFFFATIFIYMGVYYLIPLLWYFYSLINISIDYVLYNN